ncbi:MAG: ribonuclease R [Gammaproteobacteria bacterium]
MKRSQKKDPNYKEEAEKYTNPIYSRQYIMQYMESVGKPITLQQLIVAMDLSDDDEERLEALRRRLIAMQRDGQIMKTRRGSYALVNKLELIKGRVIGHKEGFGFVLPEEGGERIFLSPRQMSGVFPGDRVLVRVTNAAGFGRPEGTIIEVLERNTQQVVGRYFVQDQIAFVSPSSKNVTQDILIPPGEQVQASHGQFVVAEIIAQPSARRQPIGRIVEILGDHLAPGMEIEVAIRAYGLPHHWPSEVASEVEHFSKEVREEDKKNRKDLRELPLVTIDGEDAKDFDDAVYCERLPEGGWRLWVAIADVSHYVKIATALDQEALNRGNSVYFPGRVVPMLPEILSNQLCSLKPQVDRLCVACEIMISPQGEMTHYKFYDAVMCSKARLTYTEVADLVTGRSTSKTPLLPALKELYVLYKVLAKQRELRGALEFESIETRVIFDKNRKIKEIIPVERNDAHRMIEESMLLANVAAAKWLRHHRMPILFRIHEGPAAESLATLQDFLKSLGLHLTGEENPQPVDYAKLLQRIEGRPDKQLIQTVLLRSLSQAIYSPQESGHFGLAYPAYTHFTSPIRRYPDLLVHRALKHIAAHKTPDNFPYNTEKMQHLGEYCSMTERRADEATRDALDWLKCEYMMDKIGQTFDGIISGVTSFGLFITLKGIYIEGLLHISALKSDYYNFDAVHHRLEGQRSKKVYRLGDPIRVLVARVSMDDKEIDFDLVN